MKEQSLEQRAGRVLDAAKDALLCLGDGMVEIKQAAQIIAGREGCIVVTGIGKSAFVGQKISATLTSLGQRATFLHSVEAVHGDIGVLSEGDVLISLSFSGETKEVVKLTKYAKKHFGVSVVALTKSRHSALGKIADVVIEIKIKDEGSPNDMAPMASTTATLVLGDMLAAVLMEDSFKDDHYARLHPGGTLGLKMKKVKSLMRKNVPLVREEDTLAKVLKEIDKKSLGATGVVDKQGKIVGIITDGDIRRLLIKDLNIGDVRAGDIMTKAPKHIQEADSLEIAIAQMETHKIMHLFVTNKFMRPVGVIHIHDIVENAIVEK